MANKISDRHNTLTLFLNWCQNIPKPLHFEYQKPTEWNIFENKKDDLVIVLLEGSDGKKDHCVTLFGHWIFDSNISEALILNKKV